MRRLRQDPDIAAAGAVLGTSLYGRAADSLVTLFGYGIQPEGQGLYWLQAGADLAPADTSGVLLSSAAAGLLGASVGDTVTMVGRLDPQVMTSNVGPEAHSPGHCATGRTITGGSLRLAPSCR